MSILAIGCTHHSAPLELLERVSVPSGEVAKALDALASSAAVSEVVLVSTCNRTEVYAVYERFHEAYHDLRNTLAELAHVDPDDLSEHLTIRYDDAAVAHLFAVAAGIESAVVGENEIVGQIKSAWRSAQELESAGPELNQIFRHALEVAKRARTETSISRHITSVSQAAVAMASERLGSLEGRDVLIVGAGEMGEGMARSLASAGVRGVAVANRTLERAMELAERIGGDPVGLADLAQRLGEVDVLLTSTGASTLILEHAEIESVLEARQGRPLLVVDIAVPRDVDPAVGDIEGVTLLDMDDLKAFTEAGHLERSLEVHKVEAIIAEEVVRYHERRSAREVSPLITGLRDRAEAVRVAETERHSSRLGDLDEDQAEAIDALTRGIINKLLHEPSVQLKDAAGTAKGARLADSLRDLFGL